jgi:phenylpropionate dioxygenase-like ring-hydroxylating dioxygenase large terminal subunit
MFINFWYAAALSKELVDKPIKVRMLGRHFVLFRDGSGQAHCLSNVCVHRCGSLGHGWVRGDHVVCPYHGWEFSADGRCQRIPSLGPEQGQPPGRARVDAYPTQERYGIVFAFLGDLPPDERPPIMPIPEWDQEGWRATVVTLTMQANYIRLVENALDFSHPEFVHFFGNKGADPAYQMPDYDIEPGDWGDGASIKFPRPARGLLRFFRDSVDYTVAGTTYHGPNQFITRIDIDANMSSYQYLFETPIDLCQTRSYLVNLRNFFTSPLFDRLSDKRNMAVVREDQVIVEEIEPTIGATGTTQDLSVAADAIQIAYRRRLAEWESRGWRIDCRSLERELPGTTAHVIPSPGRRDAGNWVFPTVPLLGESSGEGSPP